MKNLFATLLMLLFCFNLHAQHAQVEKRSQTPLLFSEFKDAKILQPFGRYVKAKANIFLKDGSLVYIDAKTNKVMRAYVKNIIGVVFEDSIHFMKVDSVMARVVAQKGDNYLLRNTHVNMPLYREETDGGKGMDYFNFTDANIFLNLDTQKRNDESGIPLTDTYYFNIRGEVIKANETQFKNFVSKDQKQAFRVLKENRFWSWKDEESLKMLLDFLP